MTSAVLRRVGLLPAITLAIAASPLTAQETVTTPDVLQLAQTIEGEIESVRWYMGRPQEVRSPVPVTGVEIRENFRQAMTLWEKVNQLGVEVVGGGEAPPIVRLDPGESYGPPHVHAVLTSVLDRLGEIRDGTGIVGVTAIEAERREPAVRPDATPTDVFRSIVQSSRQVNRMLERQTQPGDVYQRVQQSIYYMSETLFALGSDNPIPATPEYEAGVQPAQVYGRLQLAFDRMTVAFESLGLSIVRWDPDAREVDDELTPSDVFDLATLLLSEIEHLHAQTPSARAPIIAAHPGRRWPSDVYQQAGLLNAQAAQLLSIARADPAALRR